MAEKTRKHVHNSAQGMFTKYWPVIALIFGIILGTAVPQLATAWHAAIFTTVTAAGAMAAIRHIRNKQGTTAASRVHN